MSEMSIDDKIFLKQCLDEYNHCVYDNVIPGSILRRIPAAAMRNEDLKEMSVVVRSNMMNFSSDLYKLLNSYKNKFVPNSPSIKETFSKIAKDYEQFVNRSENPEFKISELNVRDPLSVTVSAINLAIRSINNQIEFIRTSYKVVDSNDERFNKPTIKTIFKTESDTNYENYWAEIEKIEADLTSKKVDLYSPEYGKLIIKRLNSFKADIMSAFNKYFGKNSVFAEFNLNDMIR